jgi:DNA-binding transcriptional MerR regulator
MATYSMAELEDLTGFAARTIRNHAANGLIPKTDYGGSQTRYGREHLLRLLAIRKLKEEFYLHEVKARLAKMSLQDLEAFVAQPQPATGSRPAAPRADDGPASGERWTLILLLPGLALQVRDDAAEVVQRIASEIERTYRAR